MLSFQNMGKKQVVALHFAPYIAKIYRKRTKKGKTDRRSVPMGNPQGVLPPCVLLYACLE